MLVREAGGARLYKLGVCKRWSHRQGAEECDLSEGCSV
jgi:hypothetical protein